jgi:hypothetical protein
MSDTQLYLSIGLPVFAVMMGILANMLQVNTMNARLTSMETSFTARFASLETSVNARLATLETRLDTLIGKVVEIDNRLIRVEERLGIR